jgi:DNA-binding ferritin-like protein
MKLIDILLESTEPKSFDEFAETRMKGADKIATNAKNKGGLAMLTYHHFNVKAPYYKSAAEGKFNIKKAKKEFNECVKQLTDDMEQIAFQKLVGRIEVLGELIIKHR